MSNFDPYAPQSVAGKRFTVIGFQRNTNSIQVEKESILV